MKGTYSIAEAQAQLAQLVRHAGKGRYVDLEELER